MKKIKDKKKERVIAGPQAFDVRIGYTQGIFPSFLALLWKRRSYFFKVVVIIVYLHLKHNPCIVTYKYRPKMFGPAYTDGLQKRNTNFNLYILKDN